MSARRKNLPLVSAFALAATLVAGTAQAEDTKPRSVPLCTLEERLPLNGRLLAQIRARADYDLLLRYASDNCPGLALYLADTATATIPAATPGTTANLPSTASPVAQPPAGSGGTTAIGSAGGTGSSGNTDTGSGSGNTGTEGSDTGSEGTGTDTGDGATRDRNNNGYGNGGEGDEGDTEKGNPSGREPRNG